MYYLNFSFFTVFLKNRNIISKIKRSKVTDYAALTKVLVSKFVNIFLSINFNINNVFVAQKNRFIEMVLSNTHNIHCMNWLKIRKNIQLNSAIISKGFF